MVRRMIRILLVILLAGVCVYFGQYFLRYVFGFIDKEEMVCFDVMHGGGYRTHQKYDGFHVLTSVMTGAEHCPPLLDITVISEGKEKYISILPKARGVEKIKYSFRYKKEGFVLEKEVYEKIKATVPISRPVDKFLAAHVVSRSEAIELIEKREMACFDTLHEKGLLKEILLEEEHRARQMHDGFSVLMTRGDDCPILIRMTVTSEGKEDDLIILPESKGIKKVKYYFPNVNKGFTLKKEVYEKIKTTTPISKEVDEFLAEHVVESRPDVQ